MSGLGSGVVYGLATGYRLHVQNNAPHTDTDSLPSDLPTSTLTLQQRMEFIQYIHQLFTAPAPAPTDPLTNTDTNTVPDLPILTPGDLLLLEDATNTAPTTILTDDLPILTLTPADLLLLEVEGEGEDDTNNTNTTAPAPTDPPILVNKYQDQLTRAGVQGPRAGDLIASSWTSFNAQVSSITLEFKSIFLIYRPRTLTKNKNLHAKKLGGWAATSFLQSSSENHKKRRWYICR